MNLLTSSSECERLPQNLLTLFDELSSHVIYVADIISGQYLFISKTAPQVLGYSGEELSKAGIPFGYIFLHPEDQERVHNTYSAKMDEAIHCTPLHKDHFIFSDEYRFRQPGGHWIWVESKTTVIAYTPEGKVHQIMAVVTDITQQKARKHLLWNDLPMREQLPSKLHLQLQFEKAASAISQDQKRVMDACIDKRYQQKNHVNISNREMQVLRLIAKGYSSKILAAELHISQHTAESHRKNLLAKFNVKNTAELVNEASKSLWIR